MLWRKEVIAIYVIDLAGNEYTAQCTATNDYELNGNQSLSATFYATKTNRLFLDNIAEMWHIVDFDDVEHKIVYAKRRGVGDGLSVEIKAVPIFFDTLDTNRIYERYDEHMTASVAFGRVFDDLPFSFVINGQFDAVEWEGFGDGESKLETFKRCLERYEAEFRIVGNTIYIEHLIGRDTVHQYRHRLNASNIEQENDATSMWTYAKGYGDYEDSGEDGGGGGWETAKLTREYTSPIANVIGIRHAPPIKDGRIKHTSVLDEQLKTLVNESLRISVTADIHDLRRQGYPIAQSQVGDRVFIVDERIGLDEEVRVVEMSLTRNWRGEVVDYSLTFGSVGITKRYESKISSAVKSINDILSGKKKIPFSALDEAVQRATRDLKSAQTELIFDNGIIAQEKNDPNKLVLFNSGGIGISDDGGQTFRTAMTGSGIVADVITTGTLRSLTVESTDIFGSYIEGTTFHSIFNNKELTISGGGVETSASGITTSYLDALGHSFYRNGRNAGQVGTGNWVDDTNYIGLAFRLDDEADYMMWGDRSEVEGTFYNPLLVWHRTNEKQAAGFTFNDIVHFNSDSKFNAGSVLHVDRIKGNVGDYLYIGANEAVSITDRGLYQGDNTVYQDIIAKDFRQSSSRELKKDIKPSKRNGILEIMKSQVVDYELIANGEEFTGLIAEDENGSDTISLSDTVMVNRKAIQEIIVKVEELEKRLINE